MDKINKVASLMTGKGRENIPNLAFRGMAFFMKLMDFLTNYSSRNIRVLNIKSGQTVIDYGCGPARYIKDASRMVGTSGKVIAVDIHPLAIKNVNDKIKKYKLSNVDATLATGYKTDIESEIADVIYALDMFHMIEQPKELLTELGRLVKMDGRVIIEDGHQPRSETKIKIENSKILKIVRETKSFVECIKIK
ncbi:class I SAM-dependent methyltransferase [Ancylomarina sp.]|uniref:class I SAM-dependent methyltransferase n=1 Tax=Ancylomarina sp. TaxID=1970196 RepID=UPI00356AEECD